MDLNLQQSKVRFEPLYVLDGDGEPRAHELAVLQPDLVRDTAGRRTWVGRHL